jgi:lysophospholipase L1-like esterase
VKVLPASPGVLRLDGVGSVGGFGLLAGGSAVADGGTEPSEAERILALGDSYTAGTSVDDDERWVTKLVEKRRAAGRTVADPRVIAENEWTTEDLDEAIDEAESGGDSLADEYDLVTLLVGANNCFQEEEPAAFRQKFTAMLDRALGFAPNPVSVVVISVPDYTLTPVGQENEPEEHASRLDAYNRIIEAAAAEAGTRYVDVVPPSKEVTERPELIAEDDLHPTGEQYDMWLERIYPHAAAALEN